MVSKNPSGTSGSGSATAQIGAVNSGKVTPPATNSNPLPTGGGSPTGGGRPANDHALVSGGPFWGNPDDADYAQQNIVTIHTDGLSFQVNKAIATQMAGLIHDLVLAGYHPKSVQGYNNRAITGGTGKSNHAYGAAIDIDPGVNPRVVGKTAKFALPANVGDIAAKWGLFWGGNYKSSKDYMHFEAIGAPRTPGSPAGGALPVITPAAKAAGATVGRAATGPTPTTAGTAAAASPGVTAAGGAGPLPANATPQQIKDEVARSYGYLAAFLNDKEIGPILSRAALEDWDESRLTGALTSTKWWKTHSDATRQWDALNKIDPAKARSQVEQTAATITQQAQQSGLTLTGLQTHDMAVNALRFGWNGAQITDAVRSQAVLNPQTKAANLNKLKAEAADWMVPISDQALEKWGLDIANGKMTGDDFTSYLQTQAKSLFPSLASAIDRGVTVKQYTDPYRQYAAQLLETDPTQIDLMNDPKFSKALFNTDPKTGERTQMSLSDWQRYLRSTPDYVKTSQATDQAAQFADTITRTFGKVA